MLRVKLIAVLMLLGEVYLYCSTTPYYIKSESGRATIHASLISRLQPLTARISPVRACLEEFYSLFYRKTQERRKISAFQSQPKYKLRTPSEKSAPLAGRLLSRDCRRPAGTAVAWVDPEPPPCAYNLINNTYNCCLLFCLIADFLI